MLRIRIPNTDPDPDPRQPTLAITPEYFRIFLIRQLVFPNSLRLREISKDCCFVQHLGREEALERGPGERAAYSPAGAKYSPLLPGQY
jgi:hypothetical protein